MRHPHTLPSAGRRHQARGAALLTALIIVTLVATMSAAMVWQQWRSIQVEAAERARTQATWVLSGARDWARLILREDARTGSGGSLDHLGEPWAVPLAEARLSTFLAADRNNNADNSGPEAFLAGHIVDAQSFFNLANIAINDEPEHLIALKRLCQTAGVASSVADELAARLKQAGGATAASGPPVSSRTRPLMPRTFAELRWFGIDAQTLQRLERYVTLLPAATPINVNTASREVIAAVLGNPGVAQQIVNVRQQNPLGGEEDLRKLMPSDSPGELAGVAYNSSYFFIHGRLRLGDRVVAERSLVHREERAQITVLDRERLTFVEQER
jgi:general secretion pathway protein K